MKEHLSTRSIAAFLKRATDASPEDRVGSGFETIGARWIELGVWPGDLVLLCLPNGAALLEQFFGALSVGIVPALVAPNTPAVRLQELACVLGARAVAAPRMNPAALGVNRVETVGALEVALFEAGGPSAAAPGDVVLLTSGTSGFASGCVFSAEALLLNAERHAKSIGQRDDDVVLVNLPLHFSFALVAQALAALVIGSRLILSGPPFHPPTYARTIERHGVTISSITPVMVRSLLEMCPAAPAGLRVLTVGGDALPVEQVARLLEWQPDAELYLTYGLTQAGPRVTTLAAHAEPPARHGSVGRPLAGTEVFLQDIGDGTGMRQLVISSATVMRRRIGLVEGQPPGNTAPPGMIVTGDVFVQDREGYLYFQGRVTDYIVRDGEKICLAAVRRVASRLPGVIHVRTRVVTRDDGEIDFDLTLQSLAAGQDYDRLLRKVLRRAEMPRQLRVEVPGHAEAVPYK